MQEYYSEGSYDYILVGEPLNSYAHPYSLLKQLFNFLKPEGTLLFKLRNTFDEENLQYSLGKFNFSSFRQPFLCVPVENINQYLLEMGAEVSKILISPQQVDLKTSESLKGILSFADIANNQDTALARLFAKDYLFSIHKPATT